MFQEWLEVCSSMDIQGWIELIEVVCWGYLNKWLQTGLTEQKFIVSKVRRLEDWAWAVGSLVPAELSLLGL